MCDTSPATCGRKKYLFSFDSYSSKSQSLKNIEDSKPLPLLLSCKQFLSCWRKSLDLPHLVSINCEALPRSIIGCQTSYNYASTLLYHFCLSSPESPAYYNLSSLVPGRPSSFNQADVRCLKNIAFYNHGNGRVA